MKATDIISRVRVVLSDGDASRWKDAELVDWINDACRFVALVRPDSSVVNTTMTTVAGTKQSIADLPVPGLRLLDVIRNVSTQRAVRLIDRDILDSSQPEWHAAAPVTAVRNFIYDNRDPKTFYLFPPALAGVNLEVLYARTPEAVTLDNMATLELTLDDIYMDAVLNYTLHRAYSKGADYAQDAGLSAGYRQLVEQLLGVKTASDSRFSPDMNSPGGKPSKAQVTGGV